MSVNTENLVKTSEKFDAEENNLNKDRISSELLQERITAFLEPPQ